MSLLMVGLILGLISLFAALAYFAAPMAVWFIYGALILGVAHTAIWIWGLWVLLAIAFSVPFIRQVVITAPIFKLIQRFRRSPTMSEPERAAIEAGTVWVDGELFSGKPDFKRILAEPYPTLNSDEQAFVDGPVEQVCRMATDWEIYQRKDLPTNVWVYLKQERFLGLMIPSEYGGLGLSNTGYSAVIAKLSSRSLVYAAMVGAANWPIQLLLCYGTDEQKQRYLPKLATGEEMPCMALAEAAAEAGMGNLQSSGTVFKGEDGELYLRLNWQKQYVALGAISTLIGLAVCLRDPDNLLGTDIDIDATCVLVPADTPGVSLDQRYDPMGVPLCQSPISGRNVVLSVNQIVGGIDRAGQGWTMLMESRTASQCVSLSATYTGVAKLVSRLTSAHSVIQEQRELSNNKQERLEDPLARIAGLTYLMEAARLYTCGAMDQGEQPAVVSAIAKYHFTKLSRHIVNNGMDILGDAGVCRGPRNLLANLYTAAPIPIAHQDNQNLIDSSAIYSLSVNLCHSYIADEIAALEDNNVAAFDYALWRHVGLVLQNLTRAKILSWTRGYTVKSPVKGDTARHYQKLAWVSSTFAALSDLAMLAYGSRLKWCKKITGRFADMFSWLYLATATLRRFEAEGRREVDLPLVHWAMNHSFNQIQQALEGLLANLEIPILGSLLRATILPCLRLNPLGTIPVDSQSHAVASLLKSPDGRNHLTHGLYVPIDAEQALGRLERAYQLSIVAMPIFKQIKAALLNGQLNITPPVGRVEAALRAGVITGAESDLATTAERAQLDAIHVDSFTLTEYQRIGKEYIEEEITGAD